jgi:hypothetical protein
LRFCISRLSLGLGFSGFLLCRFTTPQKGVLRGVVSGL